MTEHAVLALAGIGVLSIICQWTAWWLKLPSILFLLIGGVLVGPATGLLKPEELFGDLLFPIVSLSVALILFEGSLTLRFEQIRGLAKVVRNLVSIGIVVTWVITALATRYVLGFSWELAWLFGAVTVVTGPTVIIPMLRTVRPNAKIANILRWEGIVIDPVGALLAVLVFEFIISGQQGNALSHTLISFGQIIVAGMSLGAIGGYLTGLVLRRHLVPEYLHNVAVLTTVFAVFALSNYIQDESGLLAVTVMGIWMANMRGVPVEDILDFKESLSVLLISGLFIILAARIEFDQFLTLGWPALVVFLIMQFLARPLKVAVSTLGSSLNWRERALLSWIAPRGIVAAAVSALFALRLSEAGFEGADLLVPMTFMIILGTVVLQSATARPLAHALRVAEPEPRGLLIVGANSLARAIAKALDEKGFHTLLADTYWENIKAARMEGRKTYFGNPTSEHADRHLDLVGIGHMLGLSPQNELNALASLRFRSEFGRAAVYTLTAKSSKESSTKSKTATSKTAGRQGYTLFGANSSYSKLSSLLSQGAEIRSTSLTESFSFEDYQAQYGKRATPLFALDSRARLHVFIAEEPMKPAAGWTIISLIQDSSKTKERTETTGEAGQSPSA